MIMRNVGPYLVAVGAAVAVPETGIAAKVFEALLTSARLPLKVPAACGAN